MRSRFFGTAVTGLVGAIVGSFSMMLFASTHFTSVAGPNNQPPSVSAAPIASGASDQDRIVNAVKRDQPSVVALNVSVNGTQYVPADPFAQFFGGPSTGTQRRYRAQASGSGFVYSRSGYIVTNAHVVTPPTGGNVSKIDVLFANGDRVTGHLYSTNPAADIALVKVDNYAKLPPPLELGDSNKLSAGQWAIAIGEPLELKQTVTVGVVSGFNRSEVIGDEHGQNARDFKGLLQTSAPINPGNSGGPLIDIEGRVIGINQATAGSSAQGIGFAIPVNQVRTDVAELVKHPGEVKPPAQAFIGASLQSIDGNVRTQLNYTGPAGVAVAGVYQGGPADSAGIQPGDVIQKVDGQNVASPDQVISKVRGLKIGQTAALQIWSQGFKKMVSLKVGAAPDNYGQQQLQQQQQQQTP